jgi:hypothetical protein
MKPIFRRLAMETPTAKFVKADVDECDTIAKRFKVASLPTVVFLRGGSTADHEVMQTRIEGFESYFRPQFAESLRMASSASEKRILALLKEGKKLKKLDSLGAAANMSTEQGEVEILATSPLQSLHSFTTKSTRIDRGMPEVSGTLAFDVVAHDAARTAVASSMLTRMRNDVVAHAGAANTTAVPKMNHLNDSVVKAFFEAPLGGDEEKEASHTMQQAKSEVSRLLKALNSLRESDSKMVEDTIPLLEKAINWVDVGLPGADGRREKVRFLLQRSSGQKTKIWLEFLFAEVSLEQKTSAN